jgi:hypothetical protein
VAVGRGVVPAPRGGIEPEFEHIAWLVGAEIIQVVLDLPEARLLVQLDRSGVLLTYGEADVVYLGVTTPIEYVFQQASSDTVAAGPFGNGHGQHPGAALPVDPDHGVPEDFASLLSDDPV